ncbi:hypothetical protein BJ741DRAFT_616539 [Chytriomyces cf. hyalinus JEL632]|nr:hypothetical protein BJ741DRAFT_616539 [Chytriomyces cf. hyalinus JEL632]
MTAQGPPPVRIGCYSAFWGDSALAATQLLSMDNPPNYVVADYLAEVTMGILARQKKGKGAGYVKEFVDSVYSPNAKRIAASKTTLITNAGGLDPCAAKAAIEAAAEEIFGKNSPHLPRVAAVFGDDAWGDDVARKEMLRLVGAGEASAFSHILPSLGSSATQTQPVDKEDWPTGKEKTILSVNVYMGVGGILQALKSNATIIVTGRVVDSALVLAPLMHEFNWSSTSYDLLAAGSLAGHIIECGCHATGGNFTDWRDSASSAHGGWSNMGYPIVEVASDGSFIVTKPPKTGGLVSVGTVAEQMIYEVLDPASYLLPDVTLDMTQVTISQIGTDRVLVSGAKGRAPSPYLKTSGVYVDGFKMSGELVIGGADSAEKARHVGEAIIKRVSTVLKKRGMEDFTDYNIECLGSEHTYGPHSKATSSRETVLRTTVVHQNKLALMLFARETPAAATSMAPGITGLGSGGRPSPAPNMRHFSILVPKASFDHLVSVTGTDGILRLEHGRNQESSNSSQKGKAANAVVSAAIGGRKEKMVKVKLIRLCFGRSGDKGDTANIGLICRDPKYYPHLVQTVTADKVKAYMGHLVQGSVERYEMPGVNGLNFVCTRALGGGGLSSLRVDRQGKTYGQMLLQMKVDVPESWSVQTSKL